MALVLRIDPASFWQRLSDPTVSSAVALSLSTTLSATAIVVLLGTPLAYLLARRRFAGRIVLDTLIDLVIVLPPAVAGIALLVAFGRQGSFWHLLGIRGVQIPFTSLAVVLAQVFVAGPFYVRSAVVALTEVRAEIEEAAAIDGATGRQIFQRVTLPLVAPALFAGMVITWARALGEFGATIIFAGNFQGTTQTVPLLIYIGFERDPQSAFTLAAVLLGLAFAVLLIVKVALRRSITDAIER